MRLQFHYLKLLAICFFVVSCSRTYVSFDDPSVPRGAYVGIMEEGANQKTILFNFIVDQDCSNVLPGNRCDDYKIAGQATIKNKLYTLVGEGHLGTWSPPAVNVPNYFSVDIFEDKARVGQIWNSDITLFESQDPVFNEIPKKGILKKANP
jgi:hypothetical protein